MLKFRFDSNDEVKEYLIRELSRGTTIVLSFIALVLFVVPIIVIEIIWYYSILALICSIALVIMCIAFILYIKWIDNPYKRDFNLFISTIIIENDTIERSGKDGYRKLNLIDVKEVRDMGTFYAFIFYFHNLDRTFVCQKDLIEEGTIEEFEEMFKDYIVRKTEKDNIK